MKVKIPREINIGTYKYIVKLDSNLPDFGLLGQCQTDDGIIKLSPEQNINVRNVSLLHEVTHAIKDVFRFDADDDTVDRIAHGMAEFLFNNLEIEFDWSLIQGGENGICNHRKAQ